MSRLLENSEEFRNSLKTRNLYQPESPYNLDSSELANSINAIADIISPFQSFDITNTVLGRSIDPNSVLAKQSLQYLGIQYARNIASNVNREFLPTLDLGKIFKGENPIVLKKDFEITRREKLGLLERLQDITGTNFMSSPFKSSSQYDVTTKEYILNTGKGQLEQLHTQLGRNIYISINEDNFRSPMRKSGFEFSNSQTSYGTTHTSNMFNPNPLYSESDQFIKNLGVTRKSGQLRAFGVEFNDYEYGLDDSTDRQLIWGLDGSTIEKDRWITQDNNVANRSKNPRFRDVDNYDNFNMINNNSLLAKTKDLLNSLEKYGKFDLTKKQFESLDGDYQYNGSPLQYRLDSSYDTSRQHTAIDQYDRYAKAIRFEGNVMYGGNENSTIYETVIPKFHPILENGDYNVEKMMFSIENLAVEVNKDVTNGVARQDDGTQLPLCEAGPFGGRIMWFPPYDIKLSEQTISRHEDTTFLGRPEPIYTYINSERQANLSFKLLIDYPPQAIGKNHIKNSTFFAFGDKDYIKNKVNDITGIENSIRELDERITTLTPIKNLAEPNFTITNSDSFYFSNDIPKEDDDLTTIISSQLSAGYEDGIDNTPNEIDGVDEKLNVGFTDNIDKLIQEYLSEENFEFVSIRIQGQATRVGPGSTESEKSKYNKLLGERRAIALKEYIKSRFRVVFPNRNPLTDSKFLLYSTGSDLAPDSTDVTSGDDVIDVISSLDSKTYRNATALFVRNGLPNTRTDELTDNERKELSRLTKEKNELINTLNSVKKSLYNTGSCNFKLYGLDDGILKGFQSFDYNVNKFQHVFHSQTPEDFHRRLTFLQQCMRQGQAIRLDRGDKKTYSAINSVYGRQPVQVLRIGDFFHTKVIITDLSIDYTDAPWDMNPEGMGMQFMIADVTMRLKLIGGQSLKTPIDILQNAVSFNYYANSTFYGDGVYKTAVNAENHQINNINQGPEKNKLSTEEKNNQNISNRNNP